MVKDYYSILGIQRDASENEIVKAFRRLAKKYHPDRNNSPDAKQKFMEIYEAYEILKDPDKRSAYDKIYNRHFVNQETQDKDAHENINYWAQKARENFSKYYSLNLKDFLKVTLDKVAYKTLKSLKFIINTVLFVITLSFSLLTFLGVVGIWEHYQRETINVNVLFNFLVIITIQIVLFYFTRKFILKYQKQYG